MMSQFFIRRPIFAWVIAIFIILFGLLSIPKLPIARFPSVAPPQVVITATYPGATPKAINDNVNSEKIKIILFILPPTFWIY